MSQAWDVLVVGAGPAGAWAACAAARRGRRVLLVDKATFPRSKVCGCCINAAALTTLGHADRAEVIGARAGEIRQVLLAAGGQRVALALSRGVAMSRSAFDAGLVKVAVAAGVTFRAGVRASLLPDRTQRRRVQIGDEVVSADIVIAADGLGGTLLDDEPGMRPRVARASRIGAGVVLDDAPGFYCNGRIHMACARYGYVGLVRLEDGRLDAAAAFDPAFIRACGSPGDAATAILREAGLPPIDALSHAAWRGTPALTRRRCVAGHRVLAVGDAAGYVEPFTGEGIAWALATGAAAGRLASLQWTRRTPQAWKREYRHITAHRRRTCRALTLALRHPRLVRTGLALLALRPGLARPVLRGLNASWSMGA